MNHPPNYIVLRSLLILKLLHSAQTYTDVPARTTAASSSRRIIHSRYCGTTESFASSTSAWIVSPIPLQICFRWIMNVIWTRHTHTHTDKCLLMNNNRTRQCTRTEWRKFNGMYAGNPLANMNRTHTHKHTSLCAAYVWTFINNHSLSLGDARQGARVRFYRNHSNWNTQTYTIPT